MKKLFYENKKKKKREEKYKELKNDSNAKDTYQNWYVRNKDTAII